LSGHSRVITMKVGAASLIVSVAGHGFINEPPSRTGAFADAASSTPYGATLWFNQGCSIGCPKCLGVDGGFNGCGSDQGQETLPSRARTYNVGKAKCGINPWCAPGSSPIMNPCGLAGGDTKQGTAGNGGDAPPGYEIGTKGTEMRDAMAGQHRTWKAGEVAEVSWAIVANHGGGYQYRLCPKDSPQTEECFQQTPLAFVGDEQFIQYCDLVALGEHGEGGLPQDATPDGFNGTTKVTPQELRAELAGCDKTSRTTISAVDVNTGTVPAGSTWRRNPIPACKGIAGGAFNMGCHVSTVDGKYKFPTAKKFEFPPAGEDKLRPGLLLGGFGVGSCFGCNQVINPSDCGTFGKLGRNNCSVDEVNAQIFKWNILDKVQVPDVPAGEYVVSFRWESEQTPQIWATCSEVTIAAGDTIV